MRPQTQRRIDALHAEIARLVEMEKKYSRKKEPELNHLWRQVADTKIEVAAWSPNLKASMGVATLSFPRGSE